MKTLIMGSAILDVMYDINELPKAGEDITATNEVNNLGGCALNVSAVLEYFKKQHDLCLFMGNGTRGNLIKNLINEECGEYAKRKYITNDEGDNGYCITLIDSNKERTFITVNGAENKFRKNWIDQFETNQYDIVYINGYMMDQYDNAKVIISILEKLSPSKIFFAIGPRYKFIDTEIIEELEKMNIIYYVNKEELCGLTGEVCIEAALKLLLNKTKNMVIATLGSEGSAYIDKSGNICTELADSVEVVNTNGAGDAHCGAFISNVMDNNYDLKISNQIAAKVVAQVKSRI